MNTNLLNIIKRIVAEKGESVLADPIKLKPLFSDYAKDEPKEERVAFGRCIEMGFYQELKNIRTADVRQNKKAILAEQLHVKTNFDKEQCEDALDLLEAVIYGKQGKQKKLTCINCNKDLQNSWLSCPFCGTAVSNGKPSVKKVNSSVLSNSNKTADECANCSYFNLKMNGCNYYGLPVNEAIKLNCDNIHKKSGNTSIMQSTPPASLVNTQNVSDNNNYQQSSPYAPGIKVRHGFTSFILWLGFIGIIIYLLVLGFDFITNGDFRAEYFPWLLELDNIDIWALRIQFILCFFALYSLIFDWKKSGFALYVFVIIASFIYGLVRENINREYLFIYIIGYVIGIYILYGILKIKNAYIGKSTWDQLG
ncbi:MAG: hypothetical protein FWD13_05390 [Treponema sp.]|nr:hypothetical protein [Treponema sp.]